jgi:hypothetical protein
MLKQINDDILNGQFKGTNEYITNYSFELDKEG